MFWRGDADKRQTFARPHPPTPATGGCFRIQGGGEKEGDWTGNLPPCAKVSSPQRPEGECPGVRAENRFANNYSQRFAPLLRRVAAALLMEKGPGDEGSGSTSQAQFGFGSLPILSSIQCIHLCGKSRSISGQPPSMTVTPCSRP